MEDHERITAYLELDKPVNIPNIQEKIELRNGQVTIGRGVINNVIWESLQISRQHATFKYVSPHWMLKDTSSNGILVNETDVPRHKWVALKDKDMISFIRTGALQYRFRVVDDIGAVSTPSCSTSGTREEVKFKTEDGSICGSSSSRFSSPKRKASSAGSSKSFKPEEKRKRLNRTETKPVEVKVEDSDDDDDEVSFLCESPSKSSSFRKNTRGSTWSAPGGLNKNDPDGIALQQMTDYENRLDEIEKEKSVLMRELVDVKKQLQNAQSDRPASREDAIQRMLVESLETEFACSICCEIFVNATVLNCGHTFCGYCTAEFMKRKPECPSCRRFVTSTEKNVAAQNLLAKLVPLLPQDTQNKREEFVQERRAAEEASAQEAAAAAAAAARPVRGGARGRGRGWGGRAGRGRRGRQVRFGLDIHFELPSPELDEVLMLEALDNLLEDIVD